MSRKNKKFILFSLGLLSSVSLAVHAQSANEKHIVVAPECLIKNLHAAYQTLSSTSGFSLIETSENGIKELSAAKHQRRLTPCGGFMDVSADWQDYKIKNHFIKDKAKSFLINFTTEPIIAKERATAYGIKYPDQVNPLVKMLDENKKQMWTDLTTLSDFHDRNAATDNGVKAAEWIKNQVETIAKSTGHNDVTVYFVKTDGFKQPSVVAKFGNADKPGIVIGSHMDTETSMFPTPTVGREPGADDDGSGTVTNLGITRTILSSGLKFEKPIYFIWYAAEEKGLVGSRYVVTDFVNKKIPVDAVLQLDMTGYANGGDPTMYLITDNINTDLTNFLETLIKTYVKQPVKRTKCGYACSDHASWNKRGFIAAFPFEAAFGKDDPYIHSKNDLMEGILSLDHIADFAKLGVAFAVELAGPIV